MSKKHKSGSTKAKAKATVKAGRKPKKKCCVSKPRCSRCPLRMLADGTLPEGYTVKKRRLVPVDGGAVDGGKHKHKRKGKGKGKGKGKIKDKRPTAA